MAKRNGSWAENTSTEDGVALTGFGEGYLPFDVLRPNIVHRASTFCMPRNNVGR